LISADDLDLRGSVSRPGTDTEKEVALDMGAVSLREMEKQAIIRSLRRWEGNRTRAAEELGISRRTLITKIAEYEISE
jgi:Transcriptional regulator containing PAS, AAA-type ATPase, and DNA-binding domains